MLESDADRLDMLRALGGIQVQVDGRSVLAIFETEYADAQLGGIVVQSAQPRLSCRTSDVEDVRTGAVANVRGASFTVTSNEPDGAGMSFLVLERA